MYVAEDNMKVFSLKKVYSAKVFLQTVQYYYSNTQTFRILMKLEPCIILKLFVNFSNSEP